MVASAYDKNRFFNKINPADRYAPADFFVGHTKKENTWMNSLCSKI